MSDIALTASAGRVDATFTASYKDVVFASSYKIIDIVAEATFPDVFSVEVITPADRRYITSAKTLADNYSGFVDLKYLQPIKNLADTFAMVDSADITYEIGKTLRDYPNVLDVLRYVASKDVGNDDLYLIDNMDGDIEFQMVKVTNELQFVADSNNLNVSKELSDSQSMADAASILLIYEREFNDLISSTSDGISAKDFSKFSTEAAITVDAKALDVEKTASDSQIVDENYANDFEKIVLGIVQDYCDATYFLEDYSLTPIVGDRLEVSIDSFFKEVIYGRVLNSPSSLSDELQPFFIEKLLQENAQPQEFYIVAIDKTTSDSLVMTDDMDGNIQYQIVKATNESQSVADDKIIDILTPKSDNISTSSSGMLAIQGYCDITYFAADYVGTAQTF